MRIYRNNGLSIVLALASITTIIGMFLTGWNVYSEELAKHGSQTVALSTYATSGHFFSALFENLESEFLQMSAYVVLTAYLFQRGSAESKDPDDRAAQDEDPAAKSEDRRAPLPVRLGGMARQFYSYSLGLALAALFLLSFLLHLRYSAEAENVEALTHSQPVQSIWEHVASAQFWFESFQNWQSEFLSTGVIVVLSIFLRYKGSPESKPVAAPRSETGS
jgi:hypothetical protein